MTVKMNIKLASIAKKLTSSIKVLALFLSIWTMTFSTVALGVGSENRLKEAQNFILDTGLNKKTTYKEFWNKTKHIYPGEVYKSAEKFFISNPNAVMPKFSVREVANSKGEKTLAITIDGDGKSHQVQILAQPDKWATFDSVALSPADFHHIEATFKKVENGLKSKSKPSKIKSNSAIQKFQGYPTIDKVTWKKMTPIERAQHIVNLRALWSASIEVLEVSNNVKSKNKTETSSLDKWNMFISFLNQEAFAATGVGGACIVAGYTGSYQRGKNGLTCNYPVGQARSSCKTPCNPVIYGYKADGNEICVSSRAELQTATHWNGVCDKASPLTIKELSLPQPKNAIRTQDSYKFAAEKNREEALLPENKAANLLKTETYLKSMLNQKGNQAVKDMFEKGDFSDEMLAQLKKIENQFNAEIITARNICVGVSDGLTKPDPKFYPACDQLHKRFLFVREYLQEKCPSGSALNDSLKCECSNDKTKVLNPNSKDTCEKAVVPPVVAPVPAPVEEKTNDNLCQDHRDNGLPVDDDCRCPSGLFPENPNKLDPDSKYTCGPEKKEDKATNWKPWLIGAGILGVAALLFLLLKKDKKKTPRPPPVVTNPPPVVINPPPVVINPPVVVPPPACTNVCDANSTRNDTTCVCTPNFNPDTCAITFDAEFCPIEGGSGDSCPSGDCSGGVPGAVVN